MARFFEDFFLRARFLEPPHMSAAMIPPIRASAPNAMRRMPHHGRLDDAAAAVVVQTTGSVVETTGSSPNGCRMPQAIAAPVLSYTITLCLFSSARSRLV